MSVSLVSNAYLDENSAKIRSKPVPWEVSSSRIHPRSLTRRIGLPARRARHFGGAGSHQKGRQTAQGKDRVHTRLRRADLCASLPSLAQEAPESGHHAMSPRLDRGRAPGYVTQLFGLTHINEAIDHDERIPLFTRAAQSDPDLPYLPLLRYPFPFVCD